MTPEGNPETVEDMAKLYWVPPYIQVSGVLALCRHCCMAGVVHDILDFPNTAKLWTIERHNPLCPHTANDGRRLRIPWGDDAFR